jgi:hypothetical protein
LTTVPIINRVENDVKTRYREYLTAKSAIKKLPYIFMQSFDINDPNSFYRDRTALTIPIAKEAIRDTTIREHNKTKEKLVNSFQRGVNIKQFGRLKGNMQYLEDS